jgi:hypothetical protein
MTGRHNRSRLESSPGLEQYKPKYDSKLKKRHPLVILWQEEMTQLQQGTALQDQVHTTLRVIRIQDKELLEEQGLEEYIKLKLHLVQELIHQRTVLHDMHQHRSLFLMYEKVCY